MGLPCKYIILHSDFVLSVNIYSLTKFPRAIFLQTTCVSCGGALDKTEQDLNFLQPTIFCTLNQDDNHLPWVCDVAKCGEKFRDLQALMRHCNYFKHQSLRCSVATCQLPISGNGHGLRTHSKEHEEVKYRCDKCELGFDNQSALDWHCWESGHAGYHCHFPDCKSECLQA